MEQQKHIQEEEISFTALIAKLVWAKNAVVSNYKWLVGICIVAVGMGYLYDWYKYNKPVYTARIVVNMEAGGNTGGGASQLNGLASAFGLGSMGGGGGGNTDMFSGDNFFELLQTKTIYFRALMKPVIINGKQDLMVNHYIKRSGILEEAWKKNEARLHFRFSLKKIDQFTSEENVIMSDIQQELSKNTLVEFVTPQSSFLRISVKTQDEQLSKAWTETFLETLFEFYKEVTTSKVSRMLNFAEQTAERYRNALYSNESALARYSDQNQQIVFQQGKLAETRLNRNNSYLSNQYLQALTNVDQLRLALIKESPLYSVVEPIRMPLGMESSSIGGSAIRAFFIGLILGIIFCLFRATYLEVVK